MEAIFAARRVSYAGLVAFCPTCPSTCSSQDILKVELNLDHLQYSSCNATIFTVHDKERHSYPNGQPILFNCTSRRSTTIGVPRVARCDATSPVLTAFKKQKDPVSCERANFARF